MVSVRRGASKLAKGAIKAVFRAIGYYPATIAGERFRGDPHHLAFWRLVGRGAWEPQTLNVIREFLSPSSVFVDIGAWIGPLALYAAPRARRVYCIEPDYVAYRHLLENIRLNNLQNVHPFNLALGAARGIRRMAPVEGDLGSTHTSLIAGGSPTDEIDVCCVRWSDWLELACVTRVDLLKVDIEGGEFELIPSMQAYLQAEKPVLCLSLHAPLLPKDQRAAALATLMDTLATYGKCFNEDRRLVSAQEVVEGPSDRFTWYLFVP